MLTVDRKLQRLARDVTTSIAAIAEEVEAVEEADAAEVVETHTGHPHAMIETGLAVVAEVADRAHHPVSVTDVTEVVVP